MSPEELMAMMPPEVAAPEEKVPSAEEGRNMDWRAEWRHDCAKALGADLSTETVSLSQKFGHIFRYKIFYREVGEAMGPGTLVLWSRDCEKFMIATYPPSFSMPG